MTDTTATLVALLRETSQAHHSAFAQVNGEDPERSN